jgi:hypothetical protein
LYSQSNQQSAIDEPSQSHAVSRKTFGTLLASAFAATLVPSPALAGLLDEFGTDPTKIVNPTKDTSESSSSQAKGEKAIDPSLRACKFG